MKELKNLILNNPNLDIIPLIGETSKIETNEELRLSKIKRAFIDEYYVLDTILCFRSQDGERLDSLPDTIIPWKKAIFVEIYEN